MVARAACVEYGAEQKPAELRALLEILIPERPQLVLEIGSAAGGTLYAWSELGAEVAAVDLHNGPYGDERPLDAHRATVIAGDSHDLKVRGAVEAWLAGRRLDFLFIDGDHTYEGVCADFQDYAPLVRKGGLVALHDICSHDFHPEVGVDRFWKELLVSAEEGFEIIAPPTFWGGIGVVRW